MKRKKKAARKTARLHEARIPVSELNLPPGTHPNDRANRERVAQRVRALTGFPEAPVQVRLGRNKHGQLLTEDYHIAVEVPLSVGRFVSLAGIDDEQAELLADVIDGLSEGEDVTLELEELAETVEDSEEDSDDDSDDEDEDDDEDGEDSEEDSPGDDNDDDSEEEEDPEERFSSKTSRQRRRARRAAPGDRRRTGKYGPNEDPTPARSLPDNAKKIYRKSFNSALDQYGDEELAHQTAWSAVKGQYKKEDGEWKEKAASAWPEVIALSRELGIESKDALRIVRAVRRAGAKEAPRILTAGKGLPFKVVAADGKPYTRRELARVVRIAMGEGKAVEAERAARQPSRRTPLSRRNGYNKRADSGEQERLRDLLISRDGRMSKEEMKKFLRQPGLKAALKSLMDNELVHKEGDDYVLTYHLSTATRRRRTNRSTPARNERNGGRRSKRSPGRRAPLDKPTAARA